MSSARSKAKSKVKTTTKAKVKGKTKAKSPAKKPSPKSVVPPPQGASARKSKPSPKSRAAEISKVVRRALDDIKAINAKVIEVGALTDIADVMVVASGNSDRHVRAIADRVISFAKEAGFRPAGVEGEREGEWVLVDLQDVIVHIMLPRVRDTYRLEALWDVSAAAREEREAVNE
jgi:ribosome-associated protein